MFQDSSSLSERERLLKEERKKRIRKRLIAAAVVEVCILMMMSYAWYYYLSHRKVYSEERDVMSPYYLYLVDETGTDSLQLTVGNLHPGETKQIVFGVTNEQPDGDSGASYSIGKNSSFNYELELAYTQNLPVEYAVYKLENANAISNSSKLNKNQSRTIEITKENNEEMYATAESATQVVNMGQYDVYDNSNGTRFVLTTTVDNNPNVTFQTDYYMIEIKWKESIVFSDYLKETDLVYVIVKAMQLEPEEATTEATQQQ